MDLQVVRCIAEVTGRCRSKRKATTLYVDIAAAVYFCSLSVADLTSFVVSVRAPSLSVELSEAFRCSTQVACFDLPGTFFPGHDLFCLTCHGLPPCKQKPLLLAERQIDREVTERVSGLALVSLISIRLSQASVSEDVLRVKYILLLLLFFLHPFQISLISPQLFA